MKTIMITGGSNGFGKAIAFEILKKGDAVVVVGSSEKNGSDFMTQAKAEGYGDRARFIQKNLSLVEENKKLVAQIKELYPKLDGMILCAEKHNLSYVETAEGIEASFALSYLSRFVLSYGLKEVLEQGENPFIMNICGSGMDGEPNWDDLQHKQSFDAQKVMMHGSRLNDLLGVQFAESDENKKIRYIMYNPWAVRTPGMKAFFNSKLMDFMYCIIGKTPEKAAKIVMNVLEKPSEGNIAAYREKKKLDLAHASYNRENAKRLYEITTAFLQKM